MAGNGEPKGSGQIGPGMMGSNGLNVEPRSRPLALDRELQPARRRTRTLAGSEGARARRPPHEQERWLAARGEGRLQPRVARPSRKDAGWQRRGDGQLRQRVVRPIRKGRWPAAKEGGASSSGEPPAPRGRTLVGSKGGRTGFAVSRPANRSAGSMTDDAGRPNEDAGEPRVSLTSRRAYRTH